LCAYYFDKNNKRINSFTKRIRAGGITINDTFYHIAQENLPFNGFGNSGMGAYHGWYSFLTFSHQKSVFRHSSLSPVSYILGAPYKSWAKSVLRFLAWW
jgi:acyl-CoA reductase-like NAD-dependent aldehyde dehydrogenase